MRPTSLGSLLLSSTDPRRLRDWYAAAFEPTDQAEVGGYLVLAFDGFAVLFDRRDDVGDRNPEPGRLVLNLEVADARATVARLDAAGATWLAELEDRDGSLFATAVDPDGNYVQVIQLSEGERRAMSVRPTTTGLEVVDAFSSFAVPDLGEARSFYAGTLGLDVDDDPAGLLTIHLGPGKDVLVYPKPDHVPATFTVLNLDVADVEAAVDRLAERGLRPERYDPFPADERGIHRGEGGPPIAWFTDPAGNVVAVLQGA